MEVFPLSPIQCQLSFQVPVDFPFDLAFSPKPFCVFLFSISGGLIPQRAVNFSADARIWKREHVSAKKLGKRDPISPEPYSINLKPCCALWIFNLPTRRFAGCVVAAYGFTGELPGTLAWID